MYNEISIEQRAHDFAVRAVLDYYKCHNDVITDSNAFEAGILYRRIYKEFLHSLEEGKTDLD